MLRDTSRSYVVLFLVWIIGCLTGGALAGLGYTIEFFGQIVLFGGLLGLGQALILLFARPFQSTLLWAATWLPVSFFSWIFGSFFFAFFAELIGVYFSQPQPATAPPGFLEVFPRFLPWIFLSIGQGIVLSIYSGQDRSAPPISYSARIVAPWSVAGSIGGILVTLIVTCSDTPFFEVLGVGELAYAAIQYTVLLGTLYAIPTGIVLALLLGRR